MREVPGTDLDEIREEEEHFSALVERELQRVVKRVTGSIGEVVVARAAVSAASPDDLNGLVPLWNQRVSTAIMPALERIVSANVSGQIAGLNTAMGSTVIRSFDEQLVTRLLLEGAENRMVGVGNELWQNARSALANGVANGESIRDIASAVREAADITTPRATTVARTEVIAASNKSSIEVMRAAGLVAQKRWIATFDSRVRLTHIAAHDQVVALDEPFDIGGSPLDHPGDYGGPPEEVINCRCAMGYVVDEDVEDPMAAATYWGARWTRA